MNESDINKMAMTGIKQMVLAVVCVVGLANHAQETKVYTHELETFSEALKLYHLEQYRAAETAFLKVKTLSQQESLVTDSEYYLANCAIRLDAPNADELIMRFVEEHPTSTKQNYAYLDVGDYYFNNGRMAYARKWYDKVEENSLTENNLDRFYFNYAYSLYATKSEKEANSYFNRVVNSKTYGAQANYYIGYMAYEKDDYDTASNYFDELKGDEAYQEKLSYYQADLNFKLGNFKKAIALAKAQLPKTNAQEKSELSKIIGESYFNLKEYDEALPYLKAYKGKKGKWTNTDYYQLGYAYYQKGDYKKAVEEFNKIIGGNDAVAQNAYYHLGECYLNLNKKTEALNAFKNASDLDYNAKIQQDAWLNYAKLSYDMGNPYQSVPEVLTTFLDKYPNSAAKERIETLLIDSYITSKNYKEALNLLDGKNSYESKQALQKVAYLRGVELFNAGDYKYSNTLFKKSLSVPIDEAYKAKATYWKAESNYNLGDFNAAILDYKQFEDMPIAQSLEEYKTFNYNLGYAYFKKKSYEASLPYFKAFIAKQTKDNNITNDAYLRLADAYFVTRNYNKAISSYKKALAIGDLEQDYAAFQVALSNGYMGRGKTKIEALIKFIDAYKTSGLRDDAMYELGNSYVKANRPDLAVEMYDDLLKAYPQSVFKPKALLRQGLVYYNTNSNGLALSKFKQVAENFPNSPEANQAVANARLIYIDLGRVNDYAAWVKGLDYIEVTDVELDKTTFLAAEKPYLENNEAKAIKQFNLYLSEFPNGLYATEAHFYLAQLYFNDGLQENALPHYKAVVVASQNEFTEQAMLKLAEIYLSDANWTDAITVLETLETGSEFTRYKRYAQSNLMKAYNEIENYDKAIMYAEQVLNHDNSNAQFKNDAYLIVARASMIQGNESKAKAAYKALENSVTGRMAAEALYYSAYFENKAENYKVSNEVIQNLVKNYSSYKEYSAKGLVIMAKNYDALNDAFQATYILESVITNFTEFEDVVEQAQEELQRIKTKEAKTNASIEPDNN